jgi:ABC-type nitrate/sulfonate/bicarbonate transport system substrate-binding protein
MSRARSVYRPIVVGVVLVTLLASSCASGSSPSKESGRTKVQVMLDWTPNTNHGGMYLAKAEGYYRAAGLDVTFIQPGQGADVNQVVAQGTVDFGVSAAEQLVPARAAGVPVVSIAAIIQHNTSSLISLQSSGITRPRELAGHTYGAFGGTFEKALIDQLVRCDGGDPSRVRFTQVGDADYREGMSRHHYDAVWVFDGWDVIRMADIDHVALNRIPFIDHTSCIPDWYTPILVTNQKLIDHDPALVRRFLAATAHGYRDAMADPSKAADALLAGAPGLDRNLVERSASYLSTRYSSDPQAWGQQDPKVWRTFVRFLEDHRIIKVGFDVSAAFSDAYLPKGG